jgi:flavin reductase (DIM6/NTAB) family NADH-FMN oxidoreductase RutF
VSQPDNGLFRHFGKGFEPGVDAFVNIDTTPGDNGLPILTSALTSMEGTVVSQMEAGDHIIYLVDITSATAHQDMSQAAPFVHLRKNGFSY